MAAAQSQKRSETVKGVRPGLRAALYYHDGARSGFHSSGLAFSTSAEKPFSCPKALDNLHAWPELGGW